MPITSSTKKTGAKSSTKSKLAESSHKTGAVVRKTHTGSVLISSEKNKPEPKSNVPLRGAGYDVLLRSAKVRSGEIKMARLSDPEMKELVTSAVERLSHSSTDALRFLTELGMVKPNGRLTKRYGGK